ncbi:MAG: TonB-dependent receptor plug domain-containing protein [Verrucomicrobiaceae bacterium]|nr:TonB-dependent receptor plug domain-containing protein [Verrucomicrobiaceae bacterium]
MKKNLTIFSALLVTAAFVVAQDAVRPTASPSPAGTAETERVVVVGGAIEQSETGKAQSITILNENSLKQKAAPNLGDTLANEPGVAGSGFTAGASRPVIRGQADNRVRVLNNGTEVFDVSNLSPDHAAERQRAPEREHRSSAWTRDDPLRLGGHRRRRQRLGRPHPGGTTEYAFAW